MNGINEIPAINSWRKSAELRAFRAAIAKHGTPYADPRAGQSFRLDGNYKVYADGARVKI